MDNTLYFDNTCATRLENAGKFVSRGIGRHPARTIESYELILVDRGVLHIAEEDQEFHVAPGETLLLWPNRFHRGQSDYSKDLCFFWTHFHPVVSLKQVEFGVPQHHRLKHPERLSHWFHRLLDDQESGHLTSARGGLLMTLMLCEIAEEQIMASSPPSAIALVARAQEFIDTNYHRPISRRDIANALQCNADYLGRVYHQVTGRTMTEGINQYRIECSLRLLRDTSRSIGQILSEVGFDHPGYYRRLFRRYQGMTPRQYRSLHSRVHIVSS